RHPGARFQPLCESRLGVALGAAHGLPEAGISGIGLEARQLGEILDPALADRAGDAAGELRIGEQEPAARRHPISLVAEALGIEIGEILHRHPAEQLRMDGSDAVGAVRTDDGEIRHADLALTTLLDEANPLDAAVIAGEAAAPLLEQAAVDLQDDLQ